MEELQVWRYDTHEIRTITREGEPWFVAKDVTDVLELDSSSVRRVDDLDKGLQKLQTPGGDQAMVVVNESGLYNLVLGSRKPEAKAFKRWITWTVLPSIRKTGSYALPSSKSVYGILRGLVDNLERQDQQIAAANVRVDEVNERVDKVIKGIPALPVPSNASEEFVTPTQIGRMFSPRLSGQEVNRLMKLAGLQYRVGDEYVPSDRGKIYAKTLPVQLDNGHCVFQLYWQRKVFNLICEVTA